MVSIRALTGLLTLAISLCGILPLFQWLTWLPRLLLILGLLSGVCQNWRRDWSLPPWIQNVAIVPVFLYYALQFSYANAVQPVVSLLAIMLAVRLAGRKTVRHSLQILALSLFCLASSSLFDLSPIFLFYLSLLLLLTAVALVLLAFQNQDDSMQLSKSHLHKVLAAGVAMPLISIPVMLIFFPVLPRTQMPLWNFLSAPTTRTSGFSDKVEPGAQPSVGESRALAFRAEMPYQSTPRLYWRGSVFNRLQGNRWVRDVNLPSEQPLISRNHIEQVIYPEPTVSKVLIAMDRPADISLHRLKRSPDGVFEHTGHFGKRLNYQARSVPDGMIAVKGLLNRPFYLHLPADVSPRVKLLAVEISGKGRDDREKLELLTSFFRNGSFRYSMTGLPTGELALERFIFEGRQGHCEFFASAFAVLLRSSGVPCRLVGGYAGGEYNRLGGYYQISEDMAHVWVEVYLEGSGWLRVDPSEFAVNAGDIFRNERDRSLILKMRMGLDYLNYEWNRLVVVYDFEQQFEYARKAGKQFKSVDPARLMHMALPAIALAAVLVVLFFAVRRTTLFRSREERILGKFLRNVEKRFGIDVCKGEAGLFEITDRTGNDRVREFVGIYAGAVYRDRRLSDNDYLRLQQILREGF